MDGNLNLLTQMRYVFNCGVQKDFRVSSVISGLPLDYKAFVRSDTC